MDRVSLLFTLCTVLLVHLQYPLTYATPFEPTVKIIGGNSKVFSGETVRLICIAPATPYNSTWTYSWYHGAKQLPHSSQKLILNNIKKKDSGKYYCQAIRDTSVQDIPTFKSVPVQINVDGGWAILDSQSQGIVSFPMNMTCRVRGNRPIHEVVLYRDGVKVLEQDNPKVILNNLTLADSGEYTCRASWNHHGRTYSVISDQVSVQVVEPLTQPTLNIVDNDELRTLSKLKLLCILEYNVPDPAPPVLYFFYINDNRHGTPTVNNYQLIERIRGTFKCKAQVSQLDLSQWSEPKSF
ncbi:hypothetical protein WMY93_028824 [Mugilogobius chulae]|uniref:Ig-like domain-containing protein n=1 Tax=Mugilogobius chulae TaxID=88201 RepID=A0AAW0MQG2_9GOBI